MIKTKSRQYQRPKSLRRGRARTSFFQKAGLALLGIFVTLLCLETGMRMLGGFMLARQRYQTGMKLKEKGTYRILCLGESTTFDEYPPLLEKRLNEANTGISFTVIDGGREATNTSIIVKELESDLDRYQPDMVIAMMGINDFADFLPQEPEPETVDKSFVHSLKIYKLFRLAQLHLAKKVDRWARIWKGKESSGPGTGDRLSLSQEEPASEKKGRTVEEYYSLIPLYQRQNDLAGLEAVYQKILELNPNDMAIAGGLGALYQSQGRLDLAEEQLRKNIERFPTVTRFYVDLGVLLGRRGHPDEAAQVIEQAHNIDPQDPNILLKLAATYHLEALCDREEAVVRRALTLYPQSPTVTLMMGEVLTYLKKLPEGEKFLKAAIQLDPKQDRAYFLLGVNYIYRGLCAQAEEPLKKAISLSPSREYFWNLSDAFTCQGKNAEATEVYQNYLELNKHDDSMMGELAAKLFSQGRRADFENILRTFWDESRETDRRSRYHPVAVKNLLLMRDILARRNIQFAAMQYPVRKVKYLKDVFGGGDEGIVFVDNEGVFKEAILKNGLSAYFVDMFAGDFGHCTPEGNRLLAENIARTILKEVFRRQDIRSPQNQ